MFNRKLHKRIKELEAKNAKLIDELDEVTTDAARLERERDKAREVRDESRRMYADLKESKEGPKVRVKLGKRGWQARIIDPDTDKVAAMFVNFHVEKQACINHAAKILNCEVAGDSS